MRVLITCEHGGNRIPAAYRRYFRGREALLQTHRAYDPGALATARAFAAALDAPLIYSTTSRLLVELNRSPGHPALYSEITRALPEPLRQELLTRHYLPYRHRVKEWLVTAVRRGERVVHLSSHSFTPRLNGQVRRADVGLLYDPARAPEARLCGAWREALLDRDATLAVRRNYPYRGTADGLITHLRRILPRARYTGIELEVNQKHFLHDPAGFRALQKMLVDALRETLDAFDPGNTA